MLLNEKVENKEVVNPHVDYPNITIDLLLRTVRLDKSKGNDLLEDKVLLAMDTINGELPIDFEINTETQKRKYIRAVCYEASALICEENLDFDTASAGQDRGERQLDKLQSLRRTVQHTIADLLGKTRNRVKLV